jgi:hypothetical protein
MINLLRKKRTSFIVCIDAALRALLRLGGNPFHPQVKGEGFNTLALIEGNIGAIMLACIDLVGAKEFVFSELFQPMGEPSGDSRHGKYRCKQIRIDAHLLVDNP